VTSLNQHSEIKGSIKESAHAKLVKLLYDQAAISIYVSLAIGGMVVYILWDVFSHKTLTVWIILISLLAVVRLVLVRQFKNKNPGKY